MIDFTDTDLTGTRFDHVRLADAVFDRVDLTGAQFHYSAVVDGSFRDV